MSDTQQMMTAVGDECNESALGIQVEPGPSPAAPACKSGKHGLLPAARPRFPRLPFFSERFTPASAAALPRCRHRSPPRPASSNWGGLAASPRLNRTAAGWGLESHAGSAPVRTSLRNRPLCDRTRPSAGGTSIYQHRNWRGKPTAGSPSQVTQAPTAPPLRPAARTSAGSRRPEAERAGPEASFRDCHVGGACGCCVDGARGRGRARWRIGLGVSAGARSRWRRAPLPPTPLSAGARPVGWPRRGALPAGGAGSGGPGSSRPRPAAP